MPESTENTDLLIEKKTLVIGASLKPHRFSNTVIRRLCEHHIPVVAVGLREGVVNDVTIFKPFPEVSNIHTVSLYVGPRNQPFWYDFILQANPRRVIFNPGTENEDFQQVLRERDIEVVTGCTLVMLSNDEY